MLNPTLASIAAAFILMAAPLAVAQGVAVADAVGGFYGGVSQRNGGADGAGLSFGHLTSSWSKFALPVADDAGARTLAYGGFRWDNDLAVEAAVATSDHGSFGPLAGAARGVKNGTWPKIVGTKGVVVS